MFATEFLMPEACAPSFTGTPVNLSAVHAIADNFRSSIVASAVRYVELSPEPCAVVYRERGHVVWARRSPRFPGKIPEQMKVGSGAAAHDYFGRGVVDPAPRSVPASVWFGRAQPSLLMEHAEVIPEPGWGDVLSLLWGTDP